MKATLDARKIHLVQDVLALDNQETIAKVEVLLQSEKERIQEKSVSKRMTHTEFGKLLKQSEKDFENSDFYSEEEVKTEMENWK